MRDTIAQTRFENVSKLSNHSLLARGNTLQSDEDRLKLNELMELCTTLQKKVLDLEKTKMTQANEITSLKRRVKKLEKKTSSRTHKLKRLYKVGLSARVESSRDEESLDDTDNEMFDANALNGDEVFAEQEVTLAQALAALKSVKPKVKRDVIEEPNVLVNAASASIKVSAATTTTAIIPTSRKGIVITELEEEANIALIEEWDDIQAKIDADHQLAKRLQAQEQKELSNAEKATIFQQLLEKRRKHFAGYKLKDLKSKGFDAIQEMFDRAFKRVNTFEDFRTELVEGKEKRAGAELVQESTKKQKVEDDKETTELKKLMKIIPDEEEVAINAIPLDVKSPRIDDWKIHKEGKKRYYQIIRADRKSQMYKIFSQMLNSFNREDLEDLYKLVKARYGSTRPVEEWIINGNSFKPVAQTTTNADGTSTEEKYKDAKTFFAAIQTRFGGNEATKKTQKTLLNQMYENFSAPSTESLDSIFNRLQKIVSQLAILGENISQEDLNLKFLRSLPSEWNTHVVVWRNKPDLDTMSFDDLYNNFKIVEQEVKGTASSSSSSSSQNMAFVSSPSSTNEVNTAYGVSTANTQVSPASTQVSTASTQVSTANLSDDTVYAFLASQPNGSQLVYEDLEQIHEDDIEEMDLKWQLALLSMRTRRFFQKTGRKITINGSDTAGYDKSKV
ncbi:hypothetical protein Tco_1219198 [Tanacetum coccineum]